MRLVTACNYLACKNVKLAGSRDVKAERTRWRQNTVPASRLAMLFTNLKKEQHNIRSITPQTASAPCTRWLAEQATAARAEADEARRRVEAERGAMEIRAAMLAPELRALEEGRAAVEGYQREGLTVLMTDMCRCNRHAGLAFA